MGGDDNTMPRPPVAQLPEGRPPAVLQVLPSLVSGGAERGTVELAAALSAAGWNAYVASAGGPLEREIARAGATHLTLPLASKNPLVLRRNRSSPGPRDPRSRHRHRPCQEPRPRVERVVGSTRDRPTFRDDVSQRLRRALGSQALVQLGHGARRAGHRYLRFCRRPCGQGVRREPDRLRTIPRGVDLDIFDPRRVGGQRIASLARQWRLPDGVPTVMLPGRLTRWKGGLDFIAAVAALGRRDICCVLVGAEQRRGFRRELETAIERRKLIGLFRIVEHCPDMAAAYMLADVVVSASSDPEGFGRTIVEAQAMGRPVVATDHGGARETIVPGATGWLVPARNPAALAAAIGAALSLGPGERSLLAKRAISHITANFTHEAMCARTIEVYEELLFPEKDPAATGIPPVALRA